MEQDNMVGTATWNGPYLSVDVPTLDLYECEQGVAVPITAEQADALADASGWDVVRTGATETTAKDDSSSTASTKDTSSQSSASSAATGTGTTDTMATPAASTPSTKTATTEGSN